METMKCDMCHKDGFEILVVLDNGMAICDDCDGLGNMSEINKMINELNERGVHFEQLIRQAHFALCDESNDQDQRQERRYSTCSHDFQCLTEV